MNRSVAVLMLAQFLSAFADNAILFTAIAMVRENAPGAWYVPALQSAFLVAFVVLAPWVGPLADRRTKPVVLIMGNALKAAGAFLMLVQVEPLLAYALVGIGAAVYGPAKYGILPELVGHSALVRANGFIEGSTIAAIILGSFVGAQVADVSITNALTLVVVCYLASLAVSLALPRMAPTHVKASYGIAHFVRLMRELFVSDRARFTMLGTSLFWGAGAVLRMILVAWVPLVLLLPQPSDVANLTLFLAVGIVIGAAIVPMLIPIERLRRARLAAYAMGVCILAFAWVDTPWAARVGLMAVGVCGGAFMVPVNAALQEIGHKTIGSGAAVALQNFFENLAMLMAVGGYGLAAQAGATPAASIAVVGTFVLFATFLVSWHLPPDPAVKTAYR
jgi:LPLT family lysophospholipid transporter-like MFS transporter